MQFFLVLLFPIALPMSFWAYSSTFSWVRTVPLVIALVAMLVLRKKDYAAVTRWGLWALLTYVLDVLAWMVSHHRIPEGSGKLTWASGTPTDALAGFPLHLLEVPPGPMGTNYPEPFQWWIVFVNLAFWAVCAAFIVFAPKYRSALRVDWLLARSRNALWAWVGAALVHQFTLFMFMIWFD